MCGTSIPWCSTRLLQQTTIRPRSCLVEVTWGPNGVYWGLSCIHNFLWLPPAVFPMPTESSRGGIRPVLGSAPEIGSASVVPGALKACGQSWTCTQESREHRLLAPAALLAASALHGDWYPNQGVVSLLGKQSLSKMLNTQENQVVGVTG